MNVCQDNKRLLIIAREVLNGKATPDTKPVSDNNGLEKITTETEGQDEVAK